MVAQPPHRLNADAGADAPQLFAQEAHIHLHMVLHRVGVVAPHLCQQRLLGDVPLRRLHQLAHDVELPRRQPHPVLPADEHVGVQLQLGIAKGEGVDLLPLAAQQGVDAGQQLPRVKGLGEVVVRAGVEALHPVQHVRTSGQHQDGGAAAAGADLPGHLEAVESGHHDVQDQQVIDAQLGVLRAALAAVDRLGLKALCLQQCFQGVGQQDLVLDDQDFHRRETSVVTDSSTIPRHAETALKTGKKSQSVHDFFRIVSARRGTIGVLKERM